jgi:hypothetical protein
LQRTGEASATKTAMEEKELYRQHQQQSKHFGKKWRIFEAEMRQMRM